MQASFKVAVLVFTALGAGGFFGARFVARSHAQTPIDVRAHRDAPTPSVFELHVPRIKSTLVIDGELDDPAWLGRIARTGAFLGASGEEARPYSDARLVWGDGKLYVALYAADEDVRAAARAADSPLSLDDAFRITFTSGGTQRILDVSATGVVTDAMQIAGGAPDYSWQSGALVAHENDGTLDDASDDDEEWLLEIAIPLRSLGLTGAKGERIGFSVRRCDTPKGTGARVCGSWGESERGAIVLD